ncbi:MAG: chromosomal replication initiator protein DnaA, partial [Verrucomicrobiales bacterium]|nr:chromosomal replication initiator protein DnaA [Verrucomicrobiales bacterium]
MNQDLSETWDRVCDYVRKHVSKDTFQRWFSATELLEHAEGGRFLVSVPNQIYQFWIESNYLPTLKLAAAAVTGEEVEFGFVTKRVKWRDPGEDEVAVNSVAAELGRSGAAVAKVVADGAGVPWPGEGAKSSERSIARRMEAGGLNDRYAFSSFVVGASNQFAHAASVQVGKCPAKTYNPLFIYGGVGLGKTHLMQAIGREITRTKPGMSVLYVTTESFVNDFIDALEEGKLAKFRKRYRRPDVLLIDDIQFLAGKERSQEEFFHTFNALSDGSRQIVLTSDRPASEIATLEERLVSRFEWGLTAHLQPPEVETRIAILHKKMAAHGVEIPEEIVRFVAENVRSNVRRLEGALMRVASLSSLNGSKVSISECEEVLRDVLEEEESPAVTIDRIQRNVADYYDIRMADMTSKRRPANIAFPRQVAMY